MESATIAAVNTIFSFPGGAAVPGYFPIQRDFLNYAPEGGLLYRLNDAWQLRSRVATGYGTPQISNLTVTAQGVSGNNSQLASQTNVGIDIGADFTPDPTAKLSTTGFYEFFRNELVTQSPGAGLQNFTFNVPRSVHRGVEVAADVTPSEPVGQEAFAVIREAMRGKGMVALGRLVLSKRERVITLEAYDKGLLGNTLRYPYEVRKAEEYFCDLPELTIAPEMLTLAEHIVDSKAGDFDPLTFRDRYEEVLLAYLRAKQAGAVPERKPTFAAPRRVINLMEALRRSLAEDKKPAAPRRGAPAAPARKRA